MVSASPFPKGVHPGKCLRGQDALDRPGGNMARIEQAESAGDRRAAYRHKCRQPVAVPKSGVDYRFGCKDALLRTPPARWIAR
jgi:hypothetical protein